MSEKCEICECELQWVLIDNYNPEVKYKVCSNCLTELVTNKLSEESWKKLIIVNGHNEEEFLLHDDFYDF